jgi:hypothetical protein
MDKLESVLILIAGLGLIPYVQGMIGASATIAGLALAIVGLKHLTAK